LPNPEGSGTAKNIDFLSSICPERKQGVLLKPDGSMVDINSLYARLLEAPPRKDGYHPMLFGNQMQRNFSLKIEQKRK
jgi:hypothetical protein